MLEMKTLKTLELDNDVGWLTIWFNQPNIRNALTADMTQELSEVLQAVKVSKDIRGITLRGRGGVFCAGGDLKALKSMASLQGETTRSDVATLSKQGAEIFKTVNTMPQVVIALVEGAAMAGGLGLACCADVMIVQEDARFAFTETAIGLTPAQISPYVIQKVGYAKGRRLMLTAARFDGAMAVTLGLADQSAQSVEELEGAEQTIRAQVMQCAPGAVADIKSLILELPYLTPDERVNAAADNFAGRVVSEEGREGLASFLEKRKPIWAEGQSK